MSTTVLSITRCTLSFAYVFNTHVYRYHLVNLDWFFLVSKRVIICIALLRTLSSCFNCKLRSIHLRKAEFNCLFFHFLPNFFPIWIFWRDNFFSLFSFSIVMWWIVFHFVKACVSFFRWNFFKNFVRIVSLRSWMCCCFIALSSYLLENCDHVWKAFNIFLYFHRFLLKLYILNVKTKKKVLLKKTDNRV